MYGELAEWFHLLSAPEEYGEEAEFYLGALSEALGGPPKTLLELGAGGGNNAWHYKHLVQSVTLTDLSRGMLALSATRNPECEHIQGDMRTVRLHRVFDTVFVHDAVCYMTDEEELKQAMATAFVHCRPGGVALFAPDHVRENFVASTDHGGNDGPSRALRYLEWTTDPDPTDSTYIVDYAFLMHEDGQPTRAASDRHLCGLFGRDQWLRLLAEVGFQASVRPFEHSEVPSGTLGAFVAVKPG
jgi:methyltransferase family protein